MDYKYLLESILEHLDEGIIVVDTNANVTFYNEPASNIAGITAEKAVGKNILDIFPDLTPETSTFYYVLRTKKPLIDYVQTYMNHQGKKVSTVTSTIPLVRNGKLVGALEIYRDLTQVKELTDKVLSLQKELFKKDQGKGRYRGNGTVYTFEDIVGESAAIRELKVKAKKVADSSSPLLVYGETGTGKELLVQAIHNASIKRRSMPFIAQNCAALPKNLLEGILFGTSAGSFTGARDKPGLFELADGGTLFLDEINSMDIELQGKLLRALQDGIIRRVGGTRTIRVDVRVVASSNIDPLEAVKKGLLREDLYYRLNVVALRVPPLRERKEDIPLLVDYFISVYNKRLGRAVEGVSPQVIDLFMGYSWPGNVRELKYAIEGAMNFVEGNVIDVKDIPGTIQNTFISCQDKDREQEERPLPTSLKEAVRDYEKKVIQEAIERARGNCAEAARLLKVPRQTLHNKIKKYGIAWEVKTE